MKRTLIFSKLSVAIAPALFAMTIGAAGSAVASEYTTIEQLEQRIADLEYAQGDAALYDTQSAVEFGAVVEVEAGYTDGGNGNSSSDMGVATVELGAEATISDSVSAAIVLLYEEDDTELDVDAAELHYAPEGTPFSFVIGKTGVPFGSFSTALVNDSLALELGETIETALVVNYDQGPMTGSFYVFNGDQDFGDQDTLSSLGGRLAFNYDAAAFGVDYISNIADSDGLQEGDYSFGGSQDRVAGMSIFGELAVGDMQLVVEHLTALDQLQNDGNNSEPSATQFEVSTQIQETVVAAAFQQTDEAEFLDLPEQRISLGMSKALQSGLHLGVEFGRDEDYAGTSTTNAVIQLAVEM